MQWIGLVFIAVMLGWILWQRRGQVSVAEARQMLKAGALLVDVRTPAEFAAGHLAGAINVPLDTLEVTIARKVPERERQLLIHCQSGVRSAMARNKLRALGYPAVGDLGSLTRAEAIVRDK